MVIITRITVLLLTIAGIGLVQAGTALAATAPNDNFANATVISALPFSDVVDNTSATTEPGEPTGPGGVAGPCVEAPQHTVWYSITPASDMTIGVDMSGSTFFDTMVNVYEQRGSGFAGLSPSIACVGFGGVATSAHFRASANMTYYIQAGSSCCTDGGLLHLNVSESLPPVDDDFANATVISPSQLPFTDTEDSSAATTQIGEPICGQTGSWWYSFTPISTGSYTASLGNSMGGIGAYTGSALTNLSQVGCARQTLTFRAIAGNTYYYQANDSEQGDSGPVTFTLDHAPPPLASFLLGSDGPSTIFVPTQFFDQSTDPAQAGIQSEVWDFGDGTTGTGSAPAHQYTVDGHYTVTLTVTTFDGRTASTSLVVDVSTHDVAIATLTVPARAKAGKTSQITVAVSNRRYPETVQVQLFSNDNQGDFGNLVGTLTLPVPVKAGKKTTQFVFSYTFTSSDATDGKVTFEAIATIQGADDALPADNIVIATTIVR